jgi:signal transduction histidine kinase
MKFTTRIILITGLSTLLLTSLYWLAGWHLVESIEDANRADILEYIATQPELQQTSIEQLLGEPDSSELMERALVIGGILLFSLGAMGITLLLIWQQTRPVRELMLAIDAVDPSSPQMTPLPRNDELGEMSRRFAQLLRRIDGFIQREQNFTRFASHELRTPLTVIHGSLDLLQEMSRDHTNPAEKRAYQRIAQAVSRMEQLTDSFLWLSREQPSEHCKVDSQSLQQLINQSDHSGLDLQLQIQPSLDWSIHPFVLSVILDNLLGNARRHGSGALTLEADIHSLIMTNPVATAGPENSQQGFGYGLPIIAQLCDKAGAVFCCRQDKQQFQARIEFQPSTRSVD